MNSGSSTLRTSIRTPSARMFDLRSASGAEPAGSPRIHSPPFARAATRNASPASARDGRQRRAAMHEVRPSLGGRKNTLHKVSLRARLLGMTLRGFVISPLELQDLRCKHYNS